MNIYFIILLVLSICYKTTALDLNAPFPSEAGDSCRKKNLHGVELKSDIDFKDLVEKTIAKGLQVVINNDPFTLDNVDFDYNSYGVKSKGGINNLILSGMRTTKISNIIVENSTSSLKFGLDIEMNQFQIIGAYKLDFSILTMLPVYGSGDIGALLEGLALNIRATLKETDNKILQMTELNIGSSLSNSKVQIDNLFNNPHLGTYLSAVLSEILPDAINDNQKVLGYANIGLRALLNMEMCSNNITLDYVIDVMQHFIA